MRAIHESYGVSAAKLDAHYHTDATAWVMFSFLRAWRLHRDPAFLFNAWTMNTKCHAQRSTARVSQFGVDRPGPQDDCQAIKSLDGRPFSGAEDLRRRSSLVRQRVVHSNHMLHSNCALYSRIRHGCAALQCWVLCLQRYP